MTTIVSIKTREGVMRGSDKRASKGFFIGSKITERLTRVNDTLAVAIAGQLSDTEYLIKVTKTERRLIELSRGFPLTGVRQVDRRPGIFWHEKLPATCC